MYDVYLGGYAGTEWRNKFSDMIGDDITIFDPIEDGYDQFDDVQKANLVAKELQHIEESQIIIFYLTKEWNSQFSMLELGDAVGRGKQVVVCIDGKIDGEEKIRRFCEYRGVLFVDNLDDLVTVTEEFLGQIELCQHVA
jgi:hypothetical protein